MSEVNYAKCFDSEETAASSSSKYSGVSFKLLVFLGVLFSLILIKSYSYRSASSGFSCDAFHAGYSPPIRPVNTPKPIPRMI